MAATKEEITDWLFDFNNEDRIAIDDGGLCLVSVKDPTVYLEVGGVPEPFDEADWREAVACGETLLGYGEWNILKNREGTVRKT